MMEFDGSVPTANSANQYDSQTSSVTAARRRRPSSPVAVQWHGLVPTDSVDTLPKRFKRLRDEWLRKVAYTNSMDEIVSSPPYREIVMIGPRVVPLILEDLEIEPKPWFSALREITGADPVKPKSAGDMKAMAAAWLAWGKKQGLR